MIRQLSILILALSMSTYTPLKAADNDDEIAEPPAKKGKLERKEIAALENDVTENNESYMYSDNRPKSKHIFTLDLSEKKWEEDDFSDYEFTDRRRLQLYHTVEEILKSEKFSSLENWCAADEVGGRVSGVFGRFKSGKLNDVFILGCQYRDKFLSPQFKKTEWETDSRINRPLKKKWYIREEESDSREFAKVSCTEFSWRWVDLSIHYMNMWVYSYKQFNAHSRKLTERLYANIRRKGLENSIMRISVVANKDSLYSFHIIYDDEYQENEARAFLLKLKNEISEKFKVQ